MRNQISGNRFSSDRSCRWTAALSFFLMLALVLTSTTLAKDEVTPIRKLTGKVSDSSLRSKRPSSGVVVDQTNWKSLWTAWRANQEIMKIDFQNQIVLVATADGPNIVLTSSLNLTPSGDLRFEVASTKMAGPGFGYALLVVPKTGIKSVNGKKLLAQPMAKPSELPPMTRSPESAKKVESGVKESIQVEIHGRVRTGVMSRATSTGTMVVANGIVWELDLHNDPQLIRAARQLGTDVGRIKGTLSKLDNPDRSFRWVVDVETIGLASSSRNQNNNQPTPTELVRSDVPKTSTPVTPQTRSTPMATRPISASPEFVATPQTEADSAIPVSQQTEQTGFRSIVVSATGGRSSLERKQTVLADGSVTLEVPKTNYSESFSLDSNSLLELHTFVANTNWRNVPRSSGTVGKDVTNFSITVDTKNGTKRFFIDGGSIRSQPVIKQLFALMRKPSSDK